MIRIRVVSPDRGRWRFLLWPTVDGGGWPVEVAEANVQLALERAVRSARLDALL